MLRIASIGECMIELSESTEGSGEPSGGMQRTFGGDTLNTAVYLARSLRHATAAVAAEVHYVTALGDDPFSDEMQAAWRQECLETDLVFRLPGRLPGLYIIRTDAAGERSFHYWRSAAAARELLGGERPVALAEALTGFHLIYLSAITLAILDAESREHLFALLGRLRNSGSRIAFDSNYRPRLWATKAEAQEAVNRAYGLATIALPTFDDEAALFDDRDPADTLRRLQARGVEEVAVKAGQDPCLVGFAGGAPAAVPISERVQPIDTTAAGDSFNAAYLAARLAGDAPEAAARAGHRLAARVIAVRGAIIPA